MKNKVSSVQISMLFALVLSSMYLGLGDIILLDISKNDAIISMIIGLILGFIPLFMYVKINNCYPNHNIFNKNKKLFGKKIGQVLNLLFVTLCFFMIIISYRSLITFINSKYLTETPYYVIGILILITSIILSANKTQTLLRVSQIMFVIVSVLIIFIEIFLFKYIEIDNILPLFKTSINDILYGAVYYASLTSITSFFFLSIYKNKASDNNFNKNMIIFYVLATISLTIVMFYIISCFGYKLASIFEYPEYVILKKIIVSNSEFHIENILSFRWIFYIISLANISIYGIKKYLEETSLSNKKQIIVVALICMLALFLSKNIFLNDPNSIIIFKKYYLFIVALPIFIILTVTFIKTLFVKKNQNWFFFIFCIF